MDLNTGQKLKKRAWPCIPILDSIVAKVKWLAEKEKKQNVEWQVMNRNNEEFSFVEKSLELRVHIGPI